jgi:hypothetical protein
MRYVRGVSIHLCWLYSMSNHTDAVYQVSHVCNAVPGTCDVMEGNRRAQDAMTMAAYARI